MIELNVTSISVRLYVSQTLALSINLGIPCGNAPYLAYAPVWFHVVDAQRF